MDFWQILVTAIGAAIVSSFSIFELLLNNRFRLFEKRFEILYSKFSQDRADVIRILYSLLVKAHKAMDKYTCLVQDSNNTNEDREKDREKAITAFEQYRTFFHENAIFFTEDTHESLEDITKRYEQLWYDCNYNKSVMMSNEYSPLERNESLYKLKNASDAITFEMPNVLKDLRNELSLILGSDLDRKKKHKKRKQAKETRS